MPFVMKPGELSLALAKITRALDRSGAGPRNSLQTVMQAFDGSPMRSSITLIFQIDPDGIVVT
jgi:hypothetical protein